MRTTSAPLLGEPLSIELMNSIWADRRGVHDALAGPDDVAAWIAALGSRLRSLGISALTGAADPLVSARLRALRDALRRLASEATRDPRPASPRVGDLPDAVAELNAAAAGSAQWQSLDWLSDRPPTRSIHNSGSAADVLIARIADDAISVFAGSGSDQLRACLAPGCVLYFIKNHPRREWCSASCGNRARVARHHERHREPS